MTDNGQCNAAEFEVGRFPIRPVWTGHSYVWEKA